MDGSHNGDSVEWLYLDSTGQEFGPFPGETMREWFSQGFFPIGDELRVRLPSWKGHVPLRTVYPEVTEAFLGPPRDVHRSGAHGPGPPPDSYGGYAAAQQWPYSGDGRGALPGRQMVDEVPPYAAPQQQFGAYWMMPPASPGSYAAAPSVGYAAAGFPAMGMRPGGYGGPPPRHQGSYGVYPPPVQKGGGPGPTTGRFQGRIKSFNAKQGFGFIECPEAHAIFGRDVFLHKQQIGDLKVGTEVTYSVEMNKQGMPQARELATLDGHAPGPSPTQGNIGGGGGGGGGGGRGKGGARGKRRTGGKGGPEDPALG